MNIAVDAGGLCIKNGFGNYSFSFNLIHALAKYDKKNKYYLYSFCDSKKILPNQDNIIITLLRPKQFWMKGRVSLEEYVQPKDIFLALNQAIPLYTKAKIISFCHGLSFHYYPNYYKDEYKRLKKQLDDMVKRSDCIIVSSIRVQRELKDIFTQLPLIKVLPFGIPFDMKGYKLNKIKRKNQFLFVGMDNPIKNVQYIIDAFLSFIKDKRYSDYQLILVGNHNRFLHIHPDISCIPYAERERLKFLYQTSYAYLTASHYESFNFPVLEALSQNCPVIGLKSAIIPEMRKYCQIVSNKAEMVEKMIKMVENEIIPSIPRFSWKTYVNKLLRQY